LVTFLHEILENNNDGLSTFVAELIDCGGIPAISTFMQQFAETNEDVQGWGCNLLKVMSSSERSPNAVVAVGD